MSTVVAQTKASTSQSSGKWLADHWFEMFLLIYGLWVLLPFLAPVLMQTGFGGVGKALYFFYAFFCHQLPARLLFLFGPKIMYSLTEIQNACQNTSNPLVLRQFLGNEQWAGRLPGLTV